MYIITLMANSLLLIIIKSEPSLHEPLYIFLAMLGDTDIAPAPALSPRCLEFLVSLSDESNLRLASFRWLIHACQIIELGVLLAMAVGHYVAICYSLRHATIFSQQLVTDIGVGVTLRATFLFIPCILLLKCHLTFYRTQLIFYAYCEYMAHVSYLQMLISSMVSLKLLLLVTLTLFDHPVLYTNIYHCLTPSPERGTLGILIHVFPTYISSSSSSSKTGSTASLSFCTHRFTLISHLTYVSLCPFF